MITQIKTEDIKKAFTHSEVEGKEFKMVYFDNDLRCCILKDLETGQTKMASYDNVKIV